MNGPALFIAVTLECQVTGLDGWILIIVRHEDRGCDFRLPTL